MKKCNITLYFFRQQPRSWFIHECIHIHSSIQFIFYNYQSKLNSRKSNIMLTHVLCTWTILTIGTCWQKHVIITKSLLAMIPNAYLTCYSNIYIKIVKFKTRIENNPRAKRLMFLFLKFILLCWWTFTIQWSENDIGISGFFANY